MLGPTKPCSFPGRPEHQDLPGRAQRKLSDGHQSYDEKKDDARHAEELLKGRFANVVLADAAYDSNRLRDMIGRKRAKAVIPNNPSRTRKYDLDRALYAERHLIEYCFAKLEQFRRVATRYEKTARNYAAVVTLAAIVLWLW